MNPIQKMLWMLLGPVRAYIRHFPLQRGKGPLIKYLIKPVLPKRPAMFETTLPGGTTIKLRYDEKIGLSTLLYGPFEGAELEYVRSALSPGDTVCDIGANVGLFSTVMSSAVGEAGRLLAFEPFPENLERLQSNLEQNHLKNATIYQVALSGYDGSEEFFLANDPAFLSTTRVLDGWQTGERIKVSCKRLDTIWKELDKPHVALMKIDVEGSEMKVLAGAREIIAHCMPRILIEANTEAELALLHECLGEFDYIYYKPGGFREWSWVFESKVE